MSIVHDGWLAVLQKQKPNWNSGSKKDEDEFLCSLAFSCADIYLNKDASAIKYKSTETLLWLLSENYMHL